MMTVGDIIGGGFRLVRERIASVAIWALLYLAMNVAVLFAIRPFMAALMAMQVAGAAGGAANPAAMLSGFGWMFGVYLLMLVGLLVLYTAALRSAVRPEDSAFAYLRLGMDELRMLGLAVILAVGFFIVYMLLVIVATVIGGAIGFMARGAMIPTVAVLMLAVICLLVFFQVRLSLTFALTLLRGRIVLGEAWALTKGHFWTLFGAYFIVVLIIFGSATVLFAINAGPYLAALGQARLSPAAIQAAQQQQMAQQFGAVTMMTVITWIIGAVLGTFWMTLAAGTTGTAARGLLDDAFADIDAIYE